MAMAAARPAGAVVIGDTYGASLSFTWVAGVRGWLAAAVPGTRFIA
jgi:hypothetical protein